MGRHGVHHADDVRAVGKVHGYAVLQQVHAPALWVALYARTADVESGLVVQAEELLNDDAWLHGQRIFQRGQPLP